MKRLVALGLVAVLALATTLGAFAIALPDSTPAVLSMKIYGGLLESGDQLAMVYFQNPYASVPTEPATDTYTWQFIDQDGSTVLGSTVGYDYVNSGYGYQVISMYFPASAGIEWNPVSPYAIRLRGNPISFATPPVYDFTVQPSNYSSLTDPAAIGTELAADILVICEDLDKKWDLSVSLISEEETGQVLSTFGQAYFRGAIYSVQALAPALFPLAIRNIDVTARTWSNAYAVALGSQYAGTWIETAKAAGAELFGLDYDLPSLIMLLAMLVGVYFANIGLTNSQWNALMDVWFVLVISARIDLIGLAYVILLDALAVIYLGLRLKSLIRS